MPERTRSVLTRAAELGVPPLLLSASPWAIRPELLGWVAEAARFPEATDVAATTEAKRKTRAGPGGVAVVPLTGIITPQGSFLSFLFGGAPGGLLAFRESLREAVASPDVSAIVLDVDSPGGLVDLVPETAAEVRAARDVKPIVAVADTQMNSAAYWIASQAKELVATPSGDAGSIGVYRMHVDWSGNNAMNGIKVSHVHAGLHKVDGNPDEPLNSEVMADWQADVNDVYDTFVADVAAGRKTSRKAVLEGYGQGRTLNAKRALEAGLVDRIDTYENVVRGLLGTSIDRQQAQALNEEPDDELVGDRPPVLDASAALAALYLS